MARKAITVDEDVWRAVKHLAVDHETTVGDVVRWLLDEYETAAAERRARHAPNRRMVVPLAALPDKGKHLKKMLAAQERAARDA